MSEGGIIEFCIEEPCKSGFLSAMKIILNGAVGSVTAYGNWADGEVVPPLKL